MDTLQAAAISRIVVMSHHCFLFFFLNDTAPDMTTAREIPAAASASSIFSVSPVLTFPDFDVLPAAEFFPAVVLPVFFGVSSVLSAALHKNRAVFTLCRLCQLL